MIQSVGLEGRAVGEYEEQQPIKTSAITIPPDGQGFDLKQRLLVVGVSLPPSLPPSLPRCLRRGPCQEESAVLPDGQVVDLKQRLLVVGVVDQAEDETQTIVPGRGREGGREGGVSDGNT